MDEAKTAGLRLKVLLNKRVAGSVGGHSHMPVSGLCLPWLIEDYGFVFSAVLYPLRCGLGGTLASFPSWAAVRCEDGLADNRALCGVV
jgi:hypothetical protein